MQQAIHTVFLVGSGPGDPELLTLKAYRCLQEADVVVYDRLVSDEIMRLVPASVERVFVGKTPYAHYIPQEKIHELLLDLALQGKRVTRLKGGDPFIFGRGGEEVLFLASHGVVVETVPGITAASGCTASAGIPLTHRGLAQSVTFVTGTCKNNMPLDLDWDMLKNNQNTIVIYMGVKRARELQDNLVQAGRLGTTPVAIIQSGTTPNEIVVETVLSQLAETIQEYDFKPPSLFVIGDVITVRQQMLAALNHDPQHAHVA